MSSAAGRRPDGHQAYRRSAMPTITPCLWFDANAEDAVKHYTSIFPNSHVIETGYYTEGSHGPVGSVMVVTFELDGQPFTALNGGPLFTFSEAVSFQIMCGDQ